MGNSVIPLLTIEETYLKYKENRNAVLSDKVVEGKFSFHKRSPRCLNQGPKSITIYRIFLDPLYQRTGILTRLIKRMIDDGYEEIAILAMQTAAIIEFAKKFEYAHHGRVLKFALAIYGDCDGDAVLRVPGGTLLTIEETYLKYKEDQNAVLPDKVVEGTFEFYKRSPDEWDGGPKSIAIYRIFLGPLYQRTGILTRLIKRMIDDGYEEIAILGMQSAAIIEFAKKFEYTSRDRVLKFTDIGGDAVLRVLPF